MNRALALGTFVLFVSCSTNQSQDRSSKIVYKSFADMGPSITLSIHLTPFAERTDREKKLQKLIVATFENFPNGFSPDLVSGHSKEEMTVSSGGKSMRLDVYALGSEERDGLTETEMAERVLFQKLLDEMMNVILDERTKREQFSGGAR